MSVRNAVSTLVLAASVLAPISSHAASLFGRSTSSNTPVTVNSKAKMIKFTLTNKTASPMTLMINDQPMTLEANSQTPVRLAEGTDIFGEDHSTLKVRVTGDLSGNTVSFR